MTKKFFTSIIFITLFAIAIPVKAMPNPASLYCEQKGGISSTESNNNGEYGVCTFAGNGICEEWSLYRGFCPIGGVLIPKWSSSAARFCLINGGRYTPTIADRGRCSLPDGRSCDAFSYYRGNCK